MAPGGITRFLSQACPAAPPCQEIRLIVQTLLSLGLKVNTGGSWRSSVLNSKKMMKGGEAGPWASCRG